MTRQEVEGLQTLYDDIQDTVNQIWPGCVMKAFGSVVMGLALKNSDVDCFVELPVSCEDEPSTCVAKCQDLITNAPSPFRQASILIKKVPIVQFFHTKTGRHCDLSFNRPIAVEFGKLVGYLLSLDTRAFKLTILIKCWAKIQKITGPRRLPSNALIILIISFLQEKDILPSVATLQKNLSPDMIEGWNTGFTEITRRSRNEESVYDLLRDFFVYYSKFNFYNSVVCPYLGHPVKRREFRNVDMTLPDFQLYEKNLDAGVCQRFFLYCIMCIQDPFDHARNCAGTVRPDEACEFIQHIKSAAAVFENTSRNGILNKLLTYEYREPEKPQYSNSWKPPPRGKYKNKSKIGHRSRAYRARGKNAFKEFI